MNFDPSPRSVESSNVLRRADEAPIGGGDPSRAVQPDSNTVSDRQLVWQTLDPLFADLSQLRQKVLAFDRQIKLFVRDDERALRLTQVGGIGPITASAIVASIGNGREIGEVIGARFANTIFLATFAACISIPLALTLGILAALYRNSYFDRTVNVLTLSSIYTPEFFVAYILILLVSY